MDALSGVESSAQGERCSLTEVAQRARRGRAYTQLCIGACTVDENLKRVGARRKLAESVAGRATHRDLFLGTPRDEPRRIARIARGEGLGGCRTHLRAVAVGEATKQPSRLAITHAGKGQERLDAHGAFFRREPPEGLGALRARERELLNRVAPRTRILRACDLKKQRLRDQREQVFILAIVCAQCLVVRRGLAEVAAHCALLKLRAQRAATAAEGERGADECGKAERSEHVHQPHPPLRWPPLKTLEECIG